MCGEKTVAALQKENEMGSPPHVRGKVSADIISCAHNRITPACAGKSGFVCFPLCSAEDHPRMCGEKRSGAGRGDQRKGSPPHVRGKGHKEEICVHVTGITPACAGKSCTKRLPMRQSKDHPRMCGEKFVATLRLSSFVGSPPHVRGKVGFAFLHTFAVGITPACAGKSRQAARYDRHPWDHPRMCGEKTKKIP